MSVEAAVIDAIFPPALFGRRRMAPDGIKRVIDVTVAILAILVLSPLMLLIAFLLFATTRSSPIFRHRRVGRDGQPFRCYKFQTMVPNAEVVLAAHLASDPEADREWLETRKLKNDPRVTAIGRILRVTSLDELPQLFNIVRGQMSFVGPRPITYAELERYGVGACQYLIARPGLTGLWQISGRSNLGYSERVALDMEYIRNRSLRLDALILIKTLPAVLRTRNAA